MASYVNKFNALLSDSDSDYDSDIEYSKTQKQSQLQTKQTSDEMLTLTYHKKSVFNKTKYVPHNKLVSKKTLSDNFPSLSNAKVNKIVTNTRRQLTFADRIKQSVKQEVNTHIKTQIKQNPTTIRITKIKPLVSSTGVEPDFSKRTRVKNYEDSQYELQRNAELVEEMEGVMSDDEFDEWFEYHKEQNPHIYTRRQQTHQQYHDDEHDDKHDDEHDDDNDNSQEYYDDYQY